ncbi:MAG: hypothetical protein Q4B88_01420 [Moraxella sp.]|nr:hypothetical protein [Moraxella sp.]
MSSSMKDPIKNPLSQYEKSKSVAMDVGDGTALGKSGVARKTAEQNAQARLVLIQLLWLAVILMIGSLVWLANNQKKLELYVEERLKVTETFEGRMNDMDDRIFAITPNNPKTEHQAEAQNDLQLITIQLSGAGRLYHAGEYQAAAELLGILQAQLSRERLQLASPLKSALKSAIKDDLVYLSAMTTTTDPWQNDVLTIRSVQSYLRQLHQDAEKSPQKELALHDATMMLSLAIGAGTLRERDTVVAYLTDSVDKLETLRPLIKTPEDDSDRSAAGIGSLDEAIFVLNELLANPPSLPPLKSIELLKNI